MVAAVSADVRDVLNNKNDAYNYQKPQQDLVQQPQPEQNFVDTELSSLPVQTYSQPQVGGAQLQAGPTSVPTLAQGASFVQAAQVAFPSFSQNTLPAFAVQAQTPLVHVAPLSSQAPLVS